MRRRPGSASAGPLVILTQVPLFLLRQNLVVFSELSQFLNNSFLTSESVWATKENSAPQMRTHRA